MKLGISKSTFYQYILLYVLVCFQGSMGFRIYNTLFVAFALTSSLFVYYYKRKFIPQHYIGFVSLLLIVLFIEIILTNGGVYLSSIISIMSRFAIVLAAYYYDEYNFTNRLVKTIVFLAFISLIGFAIVRINNAILIPLLAARSETVVTHWQTYNVMYYGTFLFAFTPSTARNIGIFHEPGLYQVVLNAALYLLLYKKHLLRIEEKKIKRYLAIVTIALITSMSATGLISMLGIYIVFFLFHNSKGVNSEMKWGIMLVLIGVMIYEVFAGQNSYFNKYILSKITSESGKIDFSVSTGYSRVLSMQSDLSIFRSYPFGIGYLNYNSAYKNNLLDQTISDTSSSVGFTQVLAILGILVFALVIFYYVYLLKRNLKGAERIALLFFFVNTGLAQPHIWFPIIVVLLLIDEKRMLWSFENGYNKMYR